MAELSLSISDCTCAKPPFTLLFPLLIQNLHKSHEKKKPEKQGTGKELLSCGSLMQGENSGLPLKGFSELHKPRAQLNYESESSCARKQLIVFFFDSKTGSQ